MSFPLHPIFVVPVVAQDAVTQKDINHADVMGKTALMHAVTGSPRAIIELLLKKGAKVQGRNKFTEENGEKYDLNVLDQAKRANRDEEIITLLQEHLDKEPKREL